VSGFVGESLACRLSVSLNEGGEASVPEYSIYP